MFQSNNDDVANRFARPTGDIRANKPRSNENRFVEASIEKELQYVEKHAKSLLLTIEKARQNRQEILTIIQETELIRLSIRKTIPYLPEQITTKEKAIEPLGITVSTPSYALLMVDMIPLNPQPTKGSYNVYYEVREALKNYLSQHPMILNPKQRYTLIYKRIVPGDLRLATGKCDNDNFEMKRVTNAITDTIGIADSVDKFSFYYTTVAGKSHHTEVILVYESQFLGNQNALYPAD